MNAEDQDFEALKRLLKLKRHEQPPPRYFNDFSSQVISKIKAEGAGQSRVAEPTASVSWVQRFMGIFQDSPSVAGILGAAACMLLIVGVLYSEKVDANPSGGPLVGSHSALNVGNSGPVLGNEAVAAYSSTNPVSPLTGSIFDSVRISTMPVGFRPNGN